MGDGRYKVSQMGLDCEEEDPIFIDEKMVTADDVVLGCELCNHLGLALKSRLGKERGVRFSDYVRKTRPISDDELCWFVECCDTQLKCHGCGNNAEAIADMVEEALKPTSSALRPKVVVGSVGSSFGRGDET